MHDPCPATEPEPLLRQMTVFGIAAIAFNGTLGAGIFGTPGAAAAATGIHSPLMFLLCGLLMTPVVLSFAQVASGFRGTGGPVLYAEQAFGSFAGFQVGWAFYITRVAASAANIALMVATLGYFAEDLDRGALRVVLLAAIVAALTWINVVGTRHALRSIGALTALKLLPLFALVGYGVTQIDPAVFAFATTPLPSADRVGTAVMLLVYAFVGWESALVPAGEARDPARDMPRALLWTLAGVTLLYVLIQTVCVGVLPELASVPGRPLVVVGAALFGSFGAVLLTAGIVVSVGGNVASATMSTPRITYAMARRGLLPAFFGGVHPRYRTPAASIVVYGVVVFALVVSGSFVELAKISVLARLLIYLAVVLASWRLPAGPMRLPGSVGIRVLAVAVCVGLLTQVGGETVLRTAVYLGVGTVLYLLRRYGV